MIIQKGISNFELVLGALYRVDCNADNYARLNLRHVSTINPEAVHDEMIQANVR